MYYLFINLFILFVYAFHVCGYQEGNFNFLLNMLNGCRSVQTFSCPEFILLNSMVFNLSILYKFHIFGVKLFITFFL